MKILDQELSVKYIQEAYRMNEQEATQIVAQ